MDQIYPDDIWEEILSRLPVKSVLRFRAVCKSWNNIVSISKFVSLHLKNSGNNNDCLLIRRNRRFFGWNLWMTWPTGSNISSGIVYGDRHCSEDDKVVGPVNGLICIHHSNYTPCMVICNPSLREIFILPQNPMIPLLSYIKGDIGAIGLGYDVVSGDYKVVHLLQTRMKPSLLYKSQVFVYSLRTTSWKELDFDLGQRMHIHIDSARGTHKGGSYIHFLVSVDKEVIVASVNMENEVLWKTNTPLVEVDRDKFETTIFAKDESFLLFHYSKLLSGFRELKVLDVWMLKGTTLGARAQWTRLSSIETLEVRRPLTLWKNLQLVFIDGWQGNLVLCDSSSGKEMTGFNSGRFNRDALWYRGSLVSILNSNKYVVDQYSSSIYY